MRTATARPCHGIIAGPNGVAPDAKIVAIKVFPSNDAVNSTCKDTAFVSDIIQGINFAISHRAEFHIGTINMSLGAEPDDATDQGYCDASEPAEAVAIDSAVAADLAVVVSSGNGLFQHSLAAPACISSAVSVGAVYSISSALVRWGDCTDQPVTPDLVTCFSNSNTNLSLLAPGAFWNTVGKGGRTVPNFGGTSASSPAAAGAFAVMRQARPDLSAFGVLGVLRSTGKPVSDPRNNIITPRIDVLAATQLATPRFGGFTGVPVAVPDGTGSASATAVISGLSGSVASVQVWAQIDHPDPRELRLRLTGPDGTSVLLHDRSGLIQQPINAVYGRTDVPAQSLSAFQGKPANGTWTLTVEDQVAGATGRIRNFSVTVIPGQPVVAIPAQTDGSVLPVVGRVQGTKFFLSDVRLYNPTAVPRTFSLFYVPVGQSGATALRATRTVGAGQVAALNDVIFSEFGFDSSIGEITVVGRRGLHRDEPRLHAERQRDVRAVRAGLPEPDRTVVRPGPRHGERFLERLEVPHQRGVHRGLRVDGHRAHRRARRERRPARVDDADRRAEPDRPHHRHHRGFRGSARRPTSASTSRSRASAGESSPSRS